MLRNACKEQDSAPPSIARRGSGRSVRMERSFHTVCNGRGYGCRFTETALLRRGDNNSGVNGLFRHDLC